MVLYFNFYHLLHRFFFYPSSRKFHLLLPRNEHIALKKLANAKHLILPPLPSNSGHFERDIYFLLLPKDPTWERSHECPLVRITHLYIFFSTLLSLRISTRFEFGKSNLPDFRFFLIIKKLSFTRFLFFFFLFQITRNEMELDGYRYMIIRLSNYRRTNCSSKRLLAEGEEEEGTLMATLGGREEGGLEINALFFASRQPPARPWIRLRFSELLGQQTSNGWF